MGIVHQLPILSVIPYGCYCYDENGLCPYWSMISVTDEHGTCDEGHCGLLRESDCILLWDQCKVCGHNEDDEDAGNGRRECDWIYMSDWQITFGIDHLHRRKTYQYGLRGEQHTLTTELISNGY